jgi:hypothetical protein
VSATIKADYPYGYETDRDVCVGTTYSDGTYLYVQVVQSGEDEFTCATAHMTRDRAREVAYALLAEIGEPVPVVNNVVIQQNANLPEVDDLPLDYALRVSELMRKQRSPFSF